MVEVWKDIEGYEGLYQVSNMGRVKSLIKGIILKQWTDKDGYRQVGLLKKTFKVHRLVAKAFIENPDDLPLVNHKDENKANNNITNLEWCTNEYNLSYGTARKKYQIL